MPTSPLPHWELSVLSRAVAYQNLSGAAGNIGLSQPQLSRIVAKLEDSVGVPLLDRASRRNSAWTAAAFKLAELYASSSAALEKQLQALAGTTQRRQLRIGTLEGLGPLAVSYCRALFKGTSLELVELDVQDVHVLEEQYFKGGFDLLFTSREPGRKKPRYSRLLGYQTIERISADSSGGTGMAAGTHVLSPFERATHKDTAGRAIQVPTQGARVLVSNSLAVRKLWLERFGGTGVVPSSVRAKGSGGTDAKGLPVYLIAADALPQPLWERISRIKASQ